MQANDINSITPQQAAGVLLLSLPHASRALQLVGHRCDEHMLARYVRDAVQVLVDRGACVSYEAVTNELAKSGTQLLNHWQCVWGDDGKWLVDAMRSVPDWLWDACNGIDSSMFGSTKGDE